MSETTTETRCSVCGAIEIGHAAWPELGHAFVASVDGTGEEQQQ